MTSPYGLPASLSAINPSSFSAGTGLTYHARIFQSHSNRKPKPQASRPEVLSNDFFSSLVPSSASGEGSNSAGGGEETRWFFSGVLNEWEGLVSLELVCLYYIERGSRIGSRIGNGGKRSRISKVSKKKVVWQGSGKPEMLEDW